MSKEYDEFINIMRQLRDPESGCPWDKVQTHESLKPSCIEEACEVISGINLLTRTGESASLKEELGDLFMGIVLQAIIAEEEGYFTMDDVIEGVRLKMIRRHPHVFGADLAASAAGMSVEDVLSGWDAIKKKEKEGKEWMDDELPEAFEESKHLIDVAVKRKADKKMKG